jgi:hypothetical protein
MQEMCSGDQLMREDVVDASHRLDHKRHAWFFGNKVR